MIHEKKKKKNLVYTSRDEIIMRNTCEYYNYSAQSATLLPLRGRLPSNAAVKSEASRQPLRTSGYAPCRVRRVRPADPRRGVPSYVYATFVSTRSSEYRRARVRLLTGSINIGALPGLICLRRELRTALVRTIQFAFILRVVLSDVFARTSIMGTIKKKKREI